MRTDIMSFVLSSEKRKTIVKTILKYGKRQWSCSDMEDIAKLSHATVYRTLFGLRDFRILKSLKINRRDIVFELVEESPIVEELRKVLNLEQFAAKKIAKEFANKIKSKTKSILLYGSAIMGNIKHYSDVDVLVILKKHDKKIENEIYDEATDLSSKYNKTISPHIIDLKEAKKKEPFFESIKENMEILYGKSPF